MELVWHSSGRHWRATLDDEEVARFTQPIFSWRTRVEVGQEVWHFTRRGGRPADAPEEGPPPLTARRASWFSSDREVATPTGTWLLRFPGFVGKTVEVWEQGWRAGEVRSPSWWRGQPVVLRLGAEAGVIDAIWISWQALDMRWRRESSWGGADGGGGGDGGGG